MREAVANNIYNRRKGTKRIDGAFRPSLRPNGLHSGFCVLLFLLLAVLPESLFAQEATWNNYNSDRPREGSYAGRRADETWQPRGDFDTNNAAANRSNIDPPMHTEPLPDPVSNPMPEPESLALPIPKELLPGPEMLRTPGGLVSTLQIMVILTVITISPSIMIMTTSFVRIMTVLAVMRQAIGTATLPPSQVITALSLFLTLLVMMPVWSKVYTESVLPFSQNEIGLQTAWEKGERPIREFMVQQIMRCQNTEDALVFLKYCKDYKAPEEMTWRDIPWRALLPAFMLSELKTSFLIGFQIYLPFLVLDMVVASVMVSMGMMMLPPVIISLPFKLMLFVLMDGWRLVVVMLLESFEMYNPETHNPLALMLPVVQNVIC